MDNHPTTVIRLEPCTCGATADPVGLAIDVAHDAQEDGRIPYRDLARIVELCDAHLILTVRTVTSMLGRSARSQDDVWQAAELRRVRLGDGTPP